MKNRDGSCRYRSASTTDFSPSAAIPARPLRSAPGPDEPRMPEDRWPLLHPHCRAKPQNAPGSRSTTSANSGRRHRGRPLAWWFVEVETMEAVPERFFCLPRDACGGPGDDSGTWSRQRAGRSDSCRCRFGAGTISRRPCVPKLMRPPCIKLLFDNAILRCILFQYVTSPRSAMAGPDSSRRPSRTRRGACKSRQRPGQAALKPLILKPFFLSLRLWRRDL